MGLGNLNNSSKDSVVIERKRWVCTFMKAEGKVFPLSIKRHEKIKELDVVHIIHWVSEGAYAALRKLQLEGEMAIK